MGADVAARIAPVLDRANQLSRQQRHVEALAHCCGALDRLGVLFGALAKTVAGVKTDAVVPELVDVPEEVWIDARRLLAAGDADVGFVLARLLMGTGIGLDQLKRQADALVPYEALVSRFGGSAHEGIQNRVAYALWNAASDLEFLGRSEEAIETFERLVSLLGHSTDDWVRVRVSWALWRAAHLLRQADRLEEAIPLFETLAARHDESLDPELPSYIASAMLEVGLATKRSGRPSEALAIYEEAIARFDGVFDERTPVRVAWAMWNSAVTLEDLDRTHDAAVAFAGLSSRFRDSNNDEVRVRVSWALWREAQLLRRDGRKAEAVPLFEELAARGDERLEPKLAGNVAFGMIEIAFGLRNDGHAREAINALDAVAARFGASDDAYTRSRAVTAQAYKAFYLGSDGDHEAAFRAWTDLTEKYGDDDSVAVQRDVLEAMEDRASLLRELGRLDEAVAVLDSALVQIGPSVESRLLVQRALLLRTKAECLFDEHRPFEAVLVCDSAVAAYLELPTADRESALTEVIIMCVLNRALVSDAVHPSSAAVITQLTAVLGDVDPPKHSLKSEPASLPEEEVAGLLAELYDNQYWLEFAAAGTDEQSRAEMQARALDLYARTESWMASDALSGDSAAALAVLMIRQIADGYALLSRPWFPDYRPHLALPLPVMFEYALRLGGVDEWSTAKGHPLELPNDDGLADELLKERISNESATTPEFADSFLRSVRFYEMLLTLSDSPTGRTTLSTDAMAAFAAAELQRSRQLASSVFPHHEEAGAAMILSLLIWEAYSIASHQPPQSSDDIFPGPLFMQNVLRETDSYAWLEREEITVPTWLTS